MGAIQECLNSIAGDGLAIDSLHAGYACWQALRCTHAIQLQVDSIELDMIKWATEVMLLS